jgi:uncharacterized protein YkwD
LFFKPSINGGDMLRPAVLIPFLLFAGSQASANPTDAVRKLFAHINAFRSEAGVTPLVLSPVLSRLAAKYMNIDRGDPCAAIARGEYKWQICGFGRGGVASGDVAAIFARMQDDDTLKSPKVSEFGVSMRLIADHWHVAYFLAMPIAGQRTLDRAEFLRLLNAFRAEEGLADVAYEPRLDKAAAGWARKHKEWKLKADHEARGSTSLKRLQAAGYKFVTAAENVGRFATPDAAAMLEGWKNSPGHRKNMVKPNVTQIGLACVSAPIRNTSPDREWAQNACVLVLGKPAD